MSHGRRIGRIKLIPPTPEVARKYLLFWSKRELYHNPAQFPPMTGQGIFGINQPIHLEIGCGTGEYLLALAEQHPDELYLGVEVSRRAVFHAVNQANKANLENVRFVFTDFKMTYPQLRPDTLKIVYLHYPDPNYASRFTKRRIFDQEFLAHIYPALAPGGIISVVTDQHQFFMDMLALAEADPRFAKTHPQRYLTSFNAPVKSRFQRAWERGKRSLFRFELKKPT